jgi:hypothetical protein
VNLHFTWPKKAGSVEYEFWISPNDRASYHFLNKFEKYGVELASFAHMKIHFVTNECTGCALQGFTKAKTDCLSGGRYCMEGNYKMNATDMLLESVYQHCLNSFHPERYFHYIRHYTRDFLEGKCESHSICSSHYMVKLGIDPTRMFRCVTDSFT